MNRRSIIRWLTLGLAITAVAATAAVLPAFGSNHEDAMRLHLNSDAHQFTDPGSGTTQAVTTGNKGCEIMPTGGALVTLSTKSGGSSPGIVGNSIGVKSGGSNANGVPCAQISGPSETLVITRNASSPTPDWHGLRLDLELKGNAWTHVTVKKGSQSRTFQLVTGSSIAAYNVQFHPDLTPAPGPPYMATSTVAAPDAACASPSDSGPDSGANDNCQWSIDPGMAFDVVEITTSVGTATLEGGGDFGPGTANDTLFFYNKAPSAVDDAYSVNQGSVLIVPAPDVPGVLFNDTDPEGDALSAVLANGPTDGTLSLQPSGGFTYTPNASFFGTDSFTYWATDGSATSSTAATVLITVNEVICPGNTITVGPGVPGGTVTGSFTFLTTEADCKPFDAEAVELEGTVLFQPTGDETVEYRAVLRLSPKGAPTGPGFGVFDLLLQYDPAGVGGENFRPVPWCINPVFTDGMVTAATIPDFPTETWCVASAYTVPVTGSSPQTLATEWQVFGRDDPKFQ